MRSEPAGTRWVEWRRRFPHLAGDLRGGLASATRLRATTFELSAALE